MKNPLHSRIFSLVLATACALLPAQRLAAAGQEPVASIQIIAFGYNSSERLVKMSDSQGTPIGSKPVGLPMNQCSALMPVPTRDLVFTPVSEGEKPTTGKPATAHLPSTGRDFVLVFLPLPTDKGGGYMIHAVELPSDRFTSGSYAFLNYTDAEIYCGMDKQKEIVGPAKAGILSPAIAEGIVRTACFEKAGDQWAERPFFSGRLPVQRGVRNLVLVSRNVQSGQIEFRGVPDFVKN